MAWSIIELEDKDQILRFLQNDRLYAAYAIGDLEPGLFENCTWTISRSSGSTAALMLVFRGLIPPPLFIMGDKLGVETLLQTKQFPKDAYLTCRDEHLEITQSFFEWQKTIPMWRMTLSLNQFKPVEGDTIRLKTSQSRQLAEHYSLGEGNAFSPAQLQDGFFYGVYQEGKLIAAAGTHIVSPTYDIAAVGNVFTHPEYRGKGYGTMTTSAVVKALHDAGISEIVLNVSQSNYSAIKIYGRLGFQFYCPFLEGPAIAR